SETLVIVRMPGDDGVGIDADLLADRVDLREHVRAASVIASAGVAGSGRIREGRMMHGQQYCAAVVCGFNVLELRGQVLELIVGNRGPAGGSLLLLSLGRLAFCGGRRGLTRYHARIFERV